MSTDDAKRIRQLQLQLADAQARIGSLETALRGARAEMGDPDCPDEKCPECVRIRDIDALLTAPR